MPRCSPAEYGRLDGRRDGTLQSGTQHRPSIFLQVNLAPSKLLLPLSYAALLGGTMTLIGASTNLMVLSMAAKKLPELKMGLFEIGVVGVPVTVAGIFYMLALSGKLLPERLAMQATNINARCVAPLFYILFSNPADIL